MCFQELLGFFKSQKISFKQFFAYSNIFRYFNVLNKKYCTVKLKLRKNALINANLSIKLCKSISGVITFQIRTKRLSCFLRPHLQTHYIQLLSLIKPASKSVLYINWWLKVVQDDLDHLLYFLFPTLPVTLIMIYLV